MAAQVIYLISLISLIALKKGDSSKGKAKYPLLQCTLTNDLQKTTLLFILNQISSIYNILVYLNKQITSEFRLSRVIGWLPSYGFSNGTMLASTTWPLNVVYLFFTSSTSASWKWIWFLHNLIEASTDLFRHPELGNQLITWESITSTGVIFNDIYEQIILQIHGEEM